MYCFNGPTQVKKETFKLNFRRQTHDDLFNTINMLVWFKTGYIAKIIFLHLVFLEIAMHEK